MDNGDDKRARTPPTRNPDRQADVAETREERLARQLRENLKRRKAQARALRADGSDR